MRKSKRNILITRSLAVDSPLQRLADDQHHIITQSFIEIVPVEINHIPKANLYFYYSKNAAKCLIQAANKLNIDISNCSHATMGTGTAKMLASLGITPTFIGNGNPKEVAQSLIAEYANQSICFVRAKKSTKSIQSRWPKEYSDLIVYDTIAKPIKIEEEINTIFATSPMNLEVALANCHVENLEKIICIGSTTYDATKRLSEVKIIKANNSNEASMLAAYLESIE